MLKETKVTKGMLVRRGVEEVLQGQSSNKKDITRLKIQNEVMDNADSIADNAKMISLLTTLLSRFYDTFSETQKAQLSVADRELTEYLFLEFSKMETRADVQFKIDGVDMIDKILIRQAKIGEIV